ncbi:haloacid dehalogenase superfamily enzyme, subfamily IA [Corynebacterium testudinoris]|uniref:Haloacid dehalogenase superfamily enzyme, subfamily IA n=2 Tax=Corynebacterium testudinoris TaxID=136857 RepID=A0A0G3HFJ6_9CORY|nr:haloacid dehalogenase superfamily enzyme, subfamily IA [Corynebacterium testudinoris]
MPASRGARLRCGLMYRAVLFDLDGTLVDHASAARIGVDAWCQTLGLPTGQWQRWHEIEQKWFTRFENGEVSHVGQRVERCKEFLGRPSLTDDEALELYEGYLSVYRSQWRAYDDARPALTAALDAGVRVGILTNGAEKLQRAKLERTGLLIDAVLLIATVELGVAKPHPAAYAAALERLGVGAEETLVVGDSWANDVAGPRAVGIDALLLQRADQPRDPAAPPDEPAMDTLVGVIDQLRA